LGDLSKISQGERRWNPPLEITRRGIGKGDSISEK